MPPRRAQRTEKPLALGFFGVGEISEKDLKSQLDDLVGKRDATVYLGITEDTAVDTFADVIDWAKEAQVPVTVFAIEDGLRRTEKSWIAAADHTQEGNDVVEQVVARLADGAVDGRMLLFWDDEEAAKEEPEDGRAFDALEAATESGVASYNVCAAMDGKLDPITLDGPEDEAAPAPEPEPEPEPEKPARGRRTRKPAAEAEPVEEKKVDEPEETPAPRRRRSSKAAEPVADEAQAETAGAKDAAFEKLAKAIEDDPKGGQGALTRTVTLKEGYEIRFVVPVELIDTIADRVFEKMAARALESAEE